MTTQQKPTVLITGASSGFGLLSAKLFQQQGWNVIAAMRSPEKDTELGQLDNLMLVKMDVTDKEAVADAVSRGVECFGRINSLVNNAGYGAFGFLEEASEQEIRRQMDTNFFGVIPLLQEVLPHMRRQRSGSIVNISSIGGMIGMPMMSLYSASKFALEGLSESLSHELETFGIKIHLVEPGAFKTGFGSAYSLNQGNAKAELDLHRELYREHLEQMMAAPPKPFGYGDPQVVAQLIYKLVSEDNQPLRNPVGKDAKLLLLFQKTMGKSRVLKMIANAAMPAFR